MRSCGWDPATGTTAHPVRKIVRLAQCIHESGAFPLETNETTRIVIGRFVESINDRARKISYSLFLFVEPMRRSFPQFLYIIEVIEDIIEDSRHYHIQRSTSA
jgi:hypothetical protein